MHGEGAFSVNYEPGACFQRARLPQSPAAALASFCRRMRPACGSACSAALSIRLMRLIARRRLLALRRLGLDRLWWLVTPGNPLKDARGLAPLAERVAAARALAHHPRIDVTDFEADLGTNYTYGTVSYLVRSCPRRAFRLDHGRRQSAQLPSLAALARNRRAGADCGDRPSRSQPLFRSGRSRPGVGLGASAGKRGDRRWRNESRRPGFICMVSSRHCHRPRCAPPERCARV